MQLASGQSHYLLGSKGKEKEKTNCIIIIDIIALHDFSYFCYMDASGREVSKNDTLIYCIYIFSQIKKSLSK